MMRRLQDRIFERKAPVVVGLDPQAGFLPPSVLSEARHITAERGRGNDDLEILGEAVWLFNRGIVDAVADLIPAVKPQIAMYEQFGIPGMIAYQRTVRYCKEKGLIVIADAKRGDIGSSSKAYATAHIGRTVVGDKQLPVFDADIVTVNPYLGIDGVEPFLEECRRYDRGIFVLVKTSNPSSGDFQDLILSDGRPLYEAVGAKVDAWGRENMDGALSNVGAVVGATYPEQGRALRQIMPNTLILVPGYGAQGGTAEDLKDFFLEDGSGAIINSSRGIIAAYKNARYQSFGEERFAEAARAATQDMIQDIGRVIRL